MKGFERVGDQLIAELTPFEVDLLFSLLGQLDEIVTVGDLPPGEDPLAMMQAEAELAPLDRTDPLVGRLFPNAYEGDDEANADFARFTEFGQRLQMVKDFAIVTGGLANTEDGLIALTVYEDQVPAWVRTLTALRLGLASRLDIVDEASLDRFDNLPEDHPDTFGWEIYEWLAFALESLLQAAV
jgi:hypothetical protein